MEFREGAWNAKPPEWVDADHLSGAIGGRLWLPTGGRLIVSELSWSSRSGVEAVHFLIRMPTGGMRRVSTHKQAITMRIIRTLVETACQDGGIDISEIVEPRFPDAVRAGNGSRTSDDQDDGDLELTWPPMRVVMFKADGLTNVVVSRLEDTSPQSVVPARGWLKTHWDNADG